MNSKSNSRSGGRDFLKESMAGSKKGPTSMSFESGNKDDLEGAPKALYSGYQESLETRSGGKDKNIFREKSQEKNFEFILKQDERS